MNYTRILRLADTIARQADYDRERSPKGFSMKEYDHPCGSPCCIAGWAVSIYHGDKPLGVGQMPHQYVAQVLGITCALSLELIMPKNRHAWYNAGSPDPDYVTAQRAAAVLRNLAKTGKVDWTVTEYTEPVERLIVYFYTERGDGASMNVDKILHLADAIEQQQDSHVSSLTGFSMRATQHNCGTPCCIAGFALVEQKVTVRNPFITGRARVLLGLTVDQAKELFTPSKPGAYWRATPDEPDYITAAHATAVLRHLARTGEVDWSVTEYMEPVERLLAEEELVTV